jgi:hypothetical protein
VLQLPRSVRLAAWGTAFLRGEEDLADAVRAVTGDDEPHRVDLGDEGGAERFIDLDEELGTLREMQVPGLRVVLPVPGDVLGLPGPPAFNQAALAAGECVLTEPVTTGRAAEIPGGHGSRGPGALVPQVTEFGSAWEPGAMVTWTRHPVTSRRVTVLGSLSEAERELREALVSATETLRRMDVARWREDAADRIAAVRDGGLPRGALPGSAPPRCVRVLGTAVRVRAVVRLAAEDDGAAVNAHEMERRTRTLRELDAVCRRAMTAAVQGMRHSRP